MIFLEYFIFILSKFELIIFLNSLFFFILFLYLHLSIYKIQPKIFTIGYILINRSISYLNFNDRKIDSLTRQATLRAPKKAAEPNERRFLVYEEKSWWMEEATRCQIPRYREVPHFIASIEKYRAANSSSPTKPKELMILSWHSNINSSINFLRLRMNSMAKLMLYRRVLIKNSRKRLNNWINCGKIWMNKKNKESINMMSPWKTPDKKLEVSYIIYSVELNDGLEK